MGTSDPIQRHKRVPLPVGRRSEMGLQQRCWMDRKQTRPCAPEIILVDARVVYLVLEL